MCIEWFYIEEMIEYKIIKEFIDWCENTERTEWLGYYNTFENVFKDYIRYKHSLTGKVGE
jgi:hypothetical protein